MGRHVHRRKKHMQFVAVTTAVTENRCKIWCCEGTLLMRRDMAREQTCCKGLICMAKLSPCNLGSIFTEI